MKCCAAIFIGLLFAHSSGHPVEGASSIIIRTITENKQMKLIL
jgi:hypothetical protein